MLNQKGIAFIPILIAGIIALTGVAVISESTGHHISFSNSPAIEKPNTPSQGQTLSINSPTLANTEPTPVSNRIRVQNLQTGQIGTMEEWDFDPKKFKKLDSPQSQTTNNKALTQSKSVKPTDKALRLAAYIFTISNETQRNELINKFSNGKNDLKLAITNLALMLDSKPEVMVSFEKAAAQDIAQKATQKTLENSDETLKYHQKELERIENLNRSLGVYSQNNTHVSQTQNTNIESGLTKKTETQNKNPYINNVTNLPNKPIINTYKESIRYDTVGDSVYGSDGSRYDVVGDSVYKNDGTRYDIVGDTIYGNNGSRYYQVGDSVYQNNGTRYDTVGDSVYGSDGSRYDVVGDSIYFHPGY